MRTWVLTVAMIAALPAAAMAADAENGKTVFNKCKACHQVDKNAVGPHLGGVVGRKAASVEGFAYSDALKKSGLTWDEASSRQVAAGTQQVGSGNKDDLCRRQGRRRARRSDRVPEDAAAGEINFSQIRRSKRRKDIPWRRFFFAIVIPLTARETEHRSRRAWQAASRWTGHQFANPARCPSAESKRTLAPRSADAECSGPPRAP